MADFENIQYLHICKCFNMESWIQKQDIKQFRCRTLYFNCYLDRILLLSNWICPKARGSLLRSDSTDAFSRRNANYLACFFWIATTRINYLYLIAHNSKETGEIIRISPRKSVRGIRPLGPEVSLKRKHVPYFILRMRELTKCNAVLTIENYIGKLSLLQ
jgi:hypothetical protein